MQLSISDIYLYFTYTEYYFINVWLHQTILNNLNLNCLFNYKIFLYILIKEKRMYIQLIK